MPDINPYNPTPQPYDPRWFIWTIVILVVTGISLVSYIMFSDTDADQVQAFSAHRVSAAKLQPKTVKK